MYLFTYGINGSHMTWISPIIYKIIHGTMLDKSFRVSLKQNVVILQITWELHGLWVVLMKELIQMLYNFSSGHRELFRNSNLSKWHATREESSNNLHFLLLTFIIWYQENLQISMPFTNSLGKNKCYANTGFEFNSLILFSMQLNTSSLANFF